MAAMTSRLVTLATLALTACFSGGTPPTTSPVGTTAPPVMAPVATTVALGFMMQSQEVIVGNDDLEDASSPARYEGYLKDLKTAFERASLATLTPAGSEGLLITYADRAKVAVPLGPITALTATALGVQKDYYTTVGTDAAPAFEFALSQLGRARSSRRILVVFGDGNSVTPLDNATLLERARREHIEIVGLVYKGALSDDATAMAPLFARTFTVRDAGEIEAALREAVLAR